VSEKMYRRVAIGIDPNDPSLLPNSERVIE
jgi:hypothetical protein